MKRIVSLILCAVLVMGMLPSIAIAATTVASGTCGDNLTWVLDSDGLLTISGSGAMEAYSSGSDVPWYSNRSKITSVSLPQGLTTIGARAFYFCSSLTSITIPDSVTSIGDSAFYYCSSLTGITIPDSVTSIGDGAFFDCSSLTSITIPDSVTSIGIYAFCSCDSLTGITIPDSVTSIGYNAFRHCSSLTSIAIPDSVTSIGTYAFNNCSSLTSASIGSGVTTIGDAAFGACDSLTGIWVNESNRYYSSNSSGVLFDKAKETLIAFPGGVSGAYTIPDSVTSIGNYAFEYCSSLTGITIPDSVTSIGYYAFGNCSSLTEVHFDGAAPSFGSGIFNKVTATAYYHGSNTTWTSDKLQSYGGTITWQSVECTTVNVSAIAPTCTEKGMTAGNRCAVCKQVFSGCTEIAALGHNYSYSVTATPSEAAAGKLTGACSRCPEVTEVTLPKLNTTDYTRTVIRNATCTASGSARYTWKDTTYGNFFFDVTISATGHNYTDTVTAPTCTQRGYTTHVCSGCGDTYTDSYVAALGHNWDAGTITKQPTESETGIKTYQCTRCTETKTETIPVLAHTHNYTSVVTNPTCTQQGYTTYTCACGDSYKSNYTPALNHNYVDGICTRCGAVDPGYVPPKPAVDGVSRLAGAGRVETCLEIAVALKERMGVTQFPNVVVASALNFPDALAGSYLAAKMDAPILLTMNSYHVNILGYISANLAPGGTVYILGGTSAVPAGFTDMLTQSNIRWERIAGNDRFGTNLEILNRAGVTTGQTILVCTGTGFADSLSVSATGHPILLVGKTLTASQKDFLNRCGGGKFYIIGGTGAVPETVERELRGYASEVERLAGAGRHETSVLVANEFFSNAESAVIAYSMNFPDGLSGGPLAYNIGAPLILTNSSDTCVNAYTDLKAIDNGYVLGGNGLINDVAVRRIFHMSTADPIN